jgi:prepilin-type N-terminal cleavage/methylation domain-containing protein
MPVLMTRSYHLSRIQSYGPGGVTMKRVDMRGVTFMELMVVIAISGILMGIAGFSMQGLRERYYMEDQVGQMCSDLMNARVRAFENNRTYFVTVTNSGYQITEDTNDSEGTMPDPGDKALWSAPKQFKFPSQWNGTIIMEAKGLISRYTGPLVTNAAFAIRFDTAGIKPEYDCISIGPVRISAGSWNGMKCAAR